MTLTRAELSGARKAALLLVQLGTARAAKVLQSLDDEEIEAVVTEVAQLDDVSDELLAAVLTEFVEHLGRPGGINRTGPAFARTMLTSGLGADRASLIIDRMATAPFQALTDLHPDQAAAVLAAEHPQTAALVLSSLAPDRALQLLRGLPADRQGDVAYRMATIDPPSPGTLAQVEAGLARRIESTVTEVRPRRTQDRTDALAALLGRADAETEATIVDELTRVDPELAARIRVKLFAFDDLVKLEDKAIQLLVREVDPKVLALALKGASESVRRKILANMSERSSANVSEEIELLGAQRRSDVEAARLDVLGAMRALEEDGKITVARGDDAYVD